LIARGMAPDYLSPCSVERFKCKQGIGSARISQGGARRSAATAKSRLTCYFSNPARALLI
jgi:hypothetical protein